MTRRLGGLRLGASEQGQQGDGPTPEDQNPVGHLFTWDLGQITSPGQPLVRLDITGDVVEEWGHRGTTPGNQGIIAPYPGGDGLLAVAIVGGDPVILHIDETGADIGTWADIFTDAGVYWADPLTAPKRIALRTDTDGRVYLFAADVSGASAENLYVLRWNADASFDQTFTLAFDLNGAGSGSRDLPPSDGGPLISQLHADAVGRIVKPCGVDITPDGTTVYATAQRHISASDLLSGPTQYLSIYSFDLDGATSAVWKQIEYYNAGYDKGGAFRTGDADGGYAASVSGLRLSHSGNKVALQYQTHETIADPRNPADGDIGVYNYFVNTYGIDSGEMASIHLATSSLANDPSSGVSSIVYSYGFANQHFALEWNGETHLYFWLYSVLTQYTALMDFATVLKPDFFRHAATSTSGLTASVTPYMALVPTTEGGCTVGAKSGDIYSYVRHQSGAQFTGGVYRYDQNAVLQEIMPVDPLGANVATVETMRLVGGDIYLVSSRTGSVVGFSGTHPHPTLRKVAGAAGHAVTTIYDWDGESHGDYAPYDLTFDSSGNLYVGVLGALQHSSAAFEPGGNALYLYKFDPTGTLLWRHGPLPTGTGGWDCGITWLTNDDKTLIYSCYDDGGDPTDSGTYFQFASQLKRYDIVADAPLPDWMRITSPYDVAGPPPEPFFELLNSHGLLLPTKKMVVAVSPEGTATHTDVDSTQGYRVPDKLLYKSGAKFGTGFFDAGTGIDSDPDGVSLWIMSGNAHDPPEDYSYLYRYNAATGAKTKGITLKDESGVPWYDAAFCICGGQGGHGNPPPNVSVVSPLRVWGQVIG